MSEFDRDIHPAGDIATRTPPDGTPAPEPGPPDNVIPIGRAAAGAQRAEPLRRRVRIRKLRVFGVLLGLTLLAMVSTLFGMMMAVTSDLPALEEPAGRNSVLVDRNGASLGLLTGNQKRIFLQSHEIAPAMKQAIIAIEDRRYYTNAGIDLRGIGRALYQDIRAQKAVQGGSTITMQFVKLALAAENERTLFQKLREAALAYQITRKWSKERILRNYLNTIYFGNGAYGIESAARTYFGFNHPGCGAKDAPKCAQLLEPGEAALIAGMVASPSAYNPLENREAAGRRRALVLQRMVEQDFITPAEQQRALLTSLPTSRDIRPPVEDTRYPYFTSWVKQQVVDKLGGGQEGARRAFDEGLTVQTTLDSRLQDAAEDAVDAWLPNRDGPRAALVALKNDTGEVLAMVGGDDYATAPFNLATQGRRQPGSAFKPFVLAQALGSGISPDSTWASRKMSHCVTRKSGECIEAFEVNNYENAYAGVQTLRSATTFSDNAVYAQVGIEVGPEKIARLARRMGIRTPVSHNLAMTLGGLRQGVTPLDMAHAYGTFARRGRFTYGSMSPDAIDRRELTTPTPGPVGIRKIGRPDDGRIKPGHAPERREGRERDARLARDEHGRRRPGRLDPLDGRHERHRGTRADPGHLRRRQDRHHRELRRRLVRGLDQGADGRGLGRIPRRAAADADRVQRPGSRGRHLPGGDLEVVHGYRARPGGVRHAGGGARRAGRPRSHRA
jgi:penicillin-binding protein 1A